VPDERPAAGEADEDAVADIPRRAGAQAALRRHQLGPPPPPPMRRRRPRPASSL